MLHQPSWAQASNFLFCSESAGPLVHVFWMAAGWLQASIIGVFVLNVVEGMWQAFLDKLVFFIYSSV